MVRDKGPAIVVRDLHKSYGRQKVLHGLDFSIQQGEVFGFLGPNGAGKTTTIRILLGLTQATAGNCELLGQDLETHRNELLTKIGVVFEHSNIYERLSGRQNLQFFADLYNIQGARVTELLQQFQLEDAANKQVRHYSKGMRQRLLLARALLHDPELLIMDEPTSGLDPTSQAWIRDTIVQMSSQGRTVFLSTHSLEEADQICQRVAVLYDGRLAAVERPSILKEYFGQPTLLVTVRTQKHAEIAAWCHDHGCSLSSDEQNRALVGLAMADARWGWLVDELQNFGEISSIHSQEASLQQVYQALTTVKEGVSPTTAK